ncbi:hypothetical protein J6590_022780 [Homalodisca vitripennis]|nr:hypothetical protein J6590_022780 [Homalodisca vitripennis]
MTVISHAEAESHLGELTWRGEGGCVPYLRHCAVTTHRSLTCHYASADLMWVNKKSWVSRFANVENVRSSRTVRGSSSLAATRQADFGSLAGRSFDESELVSCEGPRCDVQGHLKVASVLTKHLSAPLPLPACVPAVSKTGFYSQKCDILSEIIIEH